MKNVIVNRIFVVLLLVIVAWCELPPPVKHNSRYIYFLYNPTYSGYKINIEVHVYCKFYNMSTEETTIKPGNAVWFKPIEVRLSW